MAKILLINPNKWGRGITHIWIASHSGFLKRNGHKIELFDATFYNNWRHNEEDFEKEFLKTNYNQLIKYKNEDVHKELEAKISHFDPDVIFWSAISSHIHSEGEYVNIQNGYDLLKNIKIPKKTILITGGLQATSAPNFILEKMNKIQFLIRGETELALNEIANCIDNKKDFFNLNGLVYKENDSIKINPPQKILESLNILAPYDYSIFDEQVFLKKYNGKVYRGVDYELSRGCIYSCAYCVETIIQKYYGFEEKSNKTGAIKNFKSYLRHKSADLVFSEIKNLHDHYGIQIFRCQDTNFLTIDRNTLEELSIRIEESNLDIKLYIETRPEGINPKSIELLKKLKVDGIGMGIEASSEIFRQESLKRFADQNKIINAFKLLRENRIKRTAYNIIGMPSQDEESIRETIAFNKLLMPDNISVHYYSPYYGTESHRNGVKEKLFDEYEYDADAYLRSKTKNKNLTQEKLRYYKDNFIKLVRDC